MSHEFSQSAYYGYIVKGDLTGAMGYVKQFPEQADLYNRFLDVFERQSYDVYEPDIFVNEILTMYRQYYRDVFYLRHDKEEAADKLGKKLAAFLGINEAEPRLDDMEQNQLAQAFRDRGLFFRGGRTGGYYGPYIWRTTETKTYEVELPDATQTYTVKLLDDFIAKSWIDVLSFGEIGTGGWTDEDGTINCVKASYDFESEAFKVSLLKHEAQHARDLAAYPDMSSEDLEYRAKLIELIYSGERNLLEKFAGEAASSDKSSGHAAASDRIMKGFADKLASKKPEIEKLSIGQVQAIAKILFAESGRPG